MSAAKRRWLNGAVCFVAGGFGYGMIEVLWRGYTHFSMLITGGLCFCLLCRVARLEWHWLWISLIGGLAITTAELLVGCVVNLWLGWAVWDYSKEFGNLWGQICPGFSAIWCGFSALVTGVRRAGAHLARRSPVWP